jgi:hypothetical protein
VALRSKRRRKTSSLTHLPLAWRGFSCQNPEQIQEPPLPVW